MANSTLFIKKVWVDDDAYINVHDITDYEADVRDENTRQLDNILSPCDSPVGGEEEIYNFGFVELLLKEDGCMADSKVIPIERIPNPWGRHEGDTLKFPFEEFTRPFKIPKDGLYTYCKMLVPKLKHFLVEDKYEFRSTECTGFYFIEDHDLYYIGAGTYSEPMRYAVKVDADVVWEHHLEDDNQISWFTIDIFGIPYLRNCLLSLEKKLLETIHYKGIGFTCELYTESRYMRDLLLDAIRVLNWLIGKKKFDEAKALLNKITPVCGNVCGEDITSTCGCGQTFYPHGSNVYQKMSPKKSCGCGKSV